MSRRVWRRLPEAARHAKLAVLILPVLVGGCVSAQHESGSGTLDWALRPTSNDIVAASASRVESPPATEPPAPAKESPTRDEAALATLPAEASPVDKANTEIAEPPPENKPKLTAELRGRIQTDAILVNQSPTNKEAVGNIDNATGFRRARLGAQGTIGDTASWLAEFDFAGGNVSFRDFYAELDQLPWIDRLRVGHIREPFSLDIQTSSNEITFCERAPVIVLDPVRNWGVGFFSYSENERMTFAAGAFRSGTNQNTGDDFGDGNDMAYTARVTGLAFYDASFDRYRLMHLGGAFSQRFPKNDILTINSGPQSNLLSVTDNPGSPFVPTITIPASQNQLYNLQWALVLDALSFQAEWIGTSIDQIGGGPIFLNGWYAYASWFPTGEHRLYDVKDGKFGVTHVLSPVVCHSGKAFSIQGIGAWEAAARISYNNFESPNMPLSPSGQLQGDRLWEVTAGLNWYWNDNLRFMFNYEHVVPIMPGFGSSDADAFFIRTSIWW